MEAVCRLSGCLTVEAFNKRLSFTTAIAKTYPSNVPVHQSHPMKELQTTCHVDQLRGDDCQVSRLLITWWDSPIEVCWLRGIFSCK